ncbi:helix-turn-helix domain-containing protein [Acidothermaceae bacterium B102]|nr:helix-turn-helix domain-containing protein [Acidothermaceae bacterium B102]
MALVLDTATLQPSERVEAIQSAMEVAGVPALVIHEGASDRVFARIELFRLGPGVTVMRRHGSGLQLTRTPKQVRVAHLDRFSLTIMQSARWRFAQGRVETVSPVAGPGLILTDQAAPYQFHRFGGGHTLALSVDHAALGLPHDLVRAAGGRLPSSPLFGVVAEHLTRLGGQLDGLGTGTATIAVGNAVTELLRALVVSSGQPAGVLDSFPEAQCARINAYLEKHFRDPALTPEHIARHLHVSVRQVYAVWARGSELTLAQSLMQLRLEAARRELSRVDGPSQTIASVAMRSGFVDSAHFARKFRAAYGLSPREFRAAHRTR